MPPGDSRRTNSNLSQQPRTRSAIPGTSLRSSQDQAAQDAAVGIVRGQIESIFQQNAQAHAAPTQQPTPTTAAATPTATQPLPKIQAASTSFSDTSHTSRDSPYDRTHQAGRTDIRANQWNRYHSAWQDYYQQYYERYYIGEVYRMRQTLDKQEASPNSTAAPQQAPVQLSDSEETLRRLRADLLNNVRTQTVKVRNSRHFVPAFAGVLTLIMFWFFFAGGNQFILANVQAYASPGSISPANIIVDPAIDIPISEEPRLIIPKINVDVPVVYDTNNDQVSQLQAMEKGIAWFGIPGANSKPGQIGNTVLSGHSSNDLFDPGDYKFIFARLDQLVEGDTFYANFQGNRYTYEVTKKEVVKPTEVQKLVYPTDKPVMTLITCVPLGTAQNRLLITAEQINLLSDAIPAPDEADTSATDEAAMPGNSPSILSRLFGS